MINRIDCPFFGVSTIIGVHICASMKEETMPDRLEEDRKQIDEIDAQLAVLFEKRFHIVKDVIDYKIENRLPILDSGREQEIIARNCARITDDDILHYFRRLYTDMLELSKEYQQDILDSK